MLKTAAYRNEHAELVTLVRTLEARLDPVQLRQDGAPARRALSELAGKLRMHLAQEDRLLYPLALASSDALLRKMGERYQAEMGHLATAFKSYSDSWLTPRDVATKPDEFVKQTRAVLKVLGERIRRENTEFYVAIDAS